MAERTRNFLFGVDSEDVALTRLIATARRVTGFMDGAPGAPLPGWHQVGADNQALLSSLHERLAATYPDAGKPFYATRLWTNLIWQPAYLAVIAVHVHGAVPRLSDISQAIKGIDISGFRLPPAPQERGEVETLIASAGAQLRAMAETMLDEINVLTRLKRRPALRLLADRMLSLMVRLGHYRPGTTIEEQKRYCTLWLAAMGLTGEGDLETLDLANGRQVVIMARKGCCLDYLALGGVYCSTCPKQDDAVRRERQGREAAAEMDAAEAEPPR